MPWLTSSGDRAASRWRAGPHRAPVPARHSCVDSHEAARRRAGPSPGWYPSSGGGRTIGCPVSACPTITQGLPGPRRMPVSTADTGSVNGTMRGPVFASRRRSSPAVRSTSSQRNDTISECRHPVSPNHPHGGCSLARHGTYARKTPRGARIARWYCPESHTTFHHLIELKGIGLLTGEVGSGKTTVCRHVAAALHPGLYRVGYVSLTHRQRARHVQVHRLGTGASHRTLARHRLPRHPRRDHPTGVRGQAAPQSIIDAVRWSAQVRGIRRARCSGARGAECGRPRAGGRSPPGR